MAKYRMDNLTEEEKRLIRNSVQGQKTREKKQAEYVRKIRNGDFSELPGYDRLSRMEPARMTAEDAVQTSGEFDPQKAAVTAFSFGRQKKAGTSTTVQDTMKKDIERYAEEEEERHKTAAMDELAQAYMLRQGGQGKEAEGHISKSASHQTKSREYDQIAGALKNAGFEAEQQKKLAEMQSIRKSADYQKFAAAGASISNDGAIGSWMAKNPVKYVKENPTGKSYHGNPQNKLQFLTDEEYQDYNYYLGKGDKKAAQEYLKLLDRQLNARQAQKVGTDWKEISKEHPVLGFTENLATAATYGPLSLLPTVGQNIKNTVTGEYEPVDPYHPLSMDAVINKATQEGAAEGKPGWQQDLIKLGFSTGRSAVNLPFGPTAGLASMGLTAAGSASQEAAEKGATAEQALTAGLVSGAIEMATEKMPIDRLFRIAGQGKVGIKKAAAEWLKQIGVEGSEELISEYANNIADIAILGDKSDYVQYRNQLLQQGLSPEEAERMTATQFFVQNPATAFAGGAISGGVMGAGALAVNSLPNAVQNVDTAVRTKYAENYIDKHGQQDMREIGFSPVEEGATRPLTQKQIPEVKEDALPVNVLSTKYQRKVLKDNPTQFTTIKVPEGVFVDSQGAALPDSQYPKALRNYLMSRFRDQVIDFAGGEKAFLNKRGIEEYAYPAKYLNPDVKTDKMRAGSDLQNLLDGAYAKWHEDDSGHHPESTGGWDYYLVNFDVGGQRYTGKINVMNSENGRVLYDVTDIKRAPTRNSDVTARAALASGKSSLPVVSILNSELNSKLKKSVGIETFTDPLGLKRKKVTSPPETEDSPGAKSTSGAMRESSAYRRGDAPPNISIADSAGGRAQSKTRKLVGIEAFTDPLGKRRKLAGVEAFANPLGKRANSAMSPSSFSKQTGGGIDTSHLKPEVREAISDIEGTPFEDHTIISQDIAQRLQNPSGAYNKDLSRVLDSAAGKDKQLREVLRDKIERPLWAAKKEYSTQVESMLNKYYDDMQRLGIKKGSKESAAVQWYGEGQRQVNPRSSQADLVEYGLEELKRDFPKSWKNIVEADKINRSIYDELLKKVNASLASIYPDVEYRAKARAEMLDRRLSQNNRLLNEISGEGRANQERYLRSQIRKDTQELDALKRDISSGEIYRNKRVLPRKDYYHHFTEMASGLGGLKNILASSSEIDPSLVGVSEFTKPKTKWEGFAQKREGGAYVEDSIGGMLQYIPAAQYKISIDPQIARLRGIVKDLAAGTSNTRNANKLIEWMTDYTGDLAGKTNFLDRPVQKLLDRKTMKALEWLNNRVKANAISMNLSSAVSQWFNLPNAVGYVKNPADMARGVKDYCKSLAGDSDAIGKLEESGFLKERYLDNAINRFDQGVVKAPGKLADWLMEVGDRQVAEITYLSAYDQALRKGHSNPAEYADDITRRSVAGRGIGELPLTQKSRVVKLLAPFQVEINNSYQLLKEKFREKDAAGLIAIFLVSWLMNGVSEALVGRRVAFDPIDALSDAVEEAQEGGGSAAAKTAKVGARLGGEVLSNMPFGAQLADVALGLEDFEAKDVFGDSDPTRYGTGNIALTTITKPIISAARGKDVDLVDPITSIAFPRGGKQFARTLRASQDLGLLPKESVNLNTGISFEKRKVPGSYKQDGTMRFPIAQTPSNVASELAFGPYATKEGKEYLQSGRKGLSDARTAQMEEAYEDGIPPKVYYEAYYYTRKLEADKDASGKSISGSKAAKVMAYVESLDLTSAQKDKLYEFLKK